MCGNSNEQISVFRYGYIADAEKGTFELKETDLLDDTEQDKEVEISAEINIVGRK